MVRECRAYLADTVSGSSRQGIGVIKTKPAAELGTVAVQLCIIAFRYCRFPAGPPIPEILLQDIPVIEGDGFGEVAFLENPERAGVIPRPGFSSLGSGEVDGGDGMEPGIASRGGIGGELLEEVHPQRGFLPGFPAGGIFERLPIFNESSRNCPPRRRIFPFDENDPIRDLDNDINRHERVAGFCLSFRHVCFPFERCRQE